MADSCFSSMLLDPVTFSISTVTMYVWSADGLGRAEVVTFKIGLTSYLRVTRVE